MFEFERLPLMSASGRPLVHKYARHPDEPQGLVCFFPGQYYGVDGPLLYYLSDMLARNGWDTFALTYGFQTTMEPVSAGVMATTLGECQEAVRTVLRERDYGRIALVGKSIGTGVVAHLCLEEPQCAQARTVYLTPTLEVPLFDPLFARTSQPALLAVGTADPFYTPAALDRLRLQRPFSLCLIEGADHSLMIPGALDGSLAALRKVTVEAAAFIKEEKD